MPPVLWDVAEEHLDEAEFLLELWAAAARSPRFTLGKLQDTVERRLAAHLDGLVVAGPEAAERLLWPCVAADAEAPSLRVAAAALALLQEPAAGTPERLVETVGATSCEPVRSGLTRALQLCGAEVEPILKLSLYATEAPAAQAALLQVLAARRVDPGPIVGTLLAAVEPALARAASSAAAAADPAAHRAALEANLAHADPTVRAAALRTGLIWNLRSAWQACLAEARAGLPEALLLVGLLGRAEDVPLISAHLATPALRKAALWALGFTGRVDAAEACLPLLDDDDARVAGLALEAVAAISDLALWEDRFHRPPEPAPDDDDLPPLAEDLLTDLTPVPLDELPRPAPQPVRAYWVERALDSTQRWIGGEAASAASYQAALAAGSLRRSGPLSCELAIRSAGRVQLPALRLSYERPTVAPDLPLQRPPSWR